MASGFGFLFDRLGDDTELRSQTEQAASIIVGLIKEAWATASYRSTAALDMCRAIQQLDLKPDNCTKETLTAVWAVCGEFDDCALDAEWPILVHVMVRHLLQ